MFSLKEKVSLPAHGMAPAGGLSVLKIETQDGVMSCDDLAYHAHPRAGLVRDVYTYRHANFDNIRRGLHKISLAEDYGIPTVYGVLWAKVVSGGECVRNLGIISVRVVTTDGATAIVDFLRNDDATTGLNFKYHGLGTGTVAEDVADVALETELTTQYTGNVRSTGSQTNNGATVYRTAATITLDSGTPAVTEHGVFSAVTGGTLLDRSVFAPINLNGANEDGIQVQYDFTISAGG